MCAKRTIINLRVLLFRRFVCVIHWHRSRSRRRCRLRRRRPFGRFHQVWMMSAFPYTHTHKVVRQFNPIFLCAPTASTWMLNGHRNVRFTKQWIEIRIVCVRRPSNTVVVANGTNNTVDDDDDVVEGKCERLPVKCNASNWADFALRFVWRSRTFHSNANATKRNEIKFCSVELPLATRSIINVWRSHGETCEKSSFLIHFDLRLTQYSAFVARNGRRARANFSPKTFTDGNVEKLHLKRLMCSWAQTLPSIGIDRARKTFIIWSMSATSLTSCRNSLHFHFFFCIFCSRSLSSSLPRSRDGRRRGSRSDCRSAGKKAKFHLYFVVCNT